MNELSRCLCCDGDIWPVLDFGLMPLANTYNVADKFPLKVNRCSECFHLQLSQFVDPEVLYRDYVYCSGTGDTATEYFRGFARTALCHHPKAQTVLDIACNDGSQLDAFKELGLRTHGVDPAAALAMFASGNGHFVHIDFFEKSEWDKGRTFDILVAQNVLAHTPTPLEFLKKCSTLMNEDSCLFVATSQANMIVNGECDAIYHEHISYFNLSSMIRLALKADLFVTDLILHQVHGTSYIFVIRKSAGAYFVNVDDRLTWERVVGMRNPALYRWWASHVRRRIETFKRMIRRFKEDGFYTVGCGASAKGISLLNMAGTKLDILADTTPSKWNRWASGMEIIPFGEIAGIDREKVLFVILPWNLRAEVRKNVLALRNNPQDVIIDTR